MTTIEIKKESNKALDQVPENLLINILGFIKQIQADNNAP